MPGRAVPVEGGFKLSGRWNFASGVHHATWLAALGTVMVGDEPRRWPDGAPEVRHFVVPRAEACLEPSWDVAGLRGTGSDTYVLQDAFVPAARAVAVGRDARREPGPLYLFPMNLAFACGFASVSLGTAAAAVEAFLELAGAKTPRGYRTALRDVPLAQLQAGQAEAHRRAGRALLRETVREVWTEVAAVNAITLDQRARLRLATTHAIHLAAQAVDVAYTGAGASAIYQSNPLQRRFQDIHVATQHVQGRIAHYESAGRHLLGLDPDFQWL
jgi:alkylation response protein AidB-like acyl-CoA dehydrogenase